MTSMLGERGEFLLAFVALLYWVASFAVLALRLLSSTFQTLTSYGGRSEAAAAVNVVMARSHGKGRAPVRDSGGALAEGAFAWLVAPVELLMRSPLGTTRVARKSAFTGFYIVGIVSSTFLLLHGWMDNRHAGERGTSDLHGMIASSLPLGFPWMTHLPLLLFSLHCLVRLAETRMVQRFRDSDTVSLFAALAGSTFYIMAAVSSMVPVDLRASCASHRLEHSVIGQRLLGTGVVTHLSLQVLQVTAHTILSQLRRLPEPSKSHSTVETRRDAEEEEVWNHVCLRLRGRGVANATSLADVEALSNPLDLRGTWRYYRYPYAGRLGGFHVVLDPHYTGEVAMYAVNSILILLCVCPAALWPAAAKVNGSVTPTSIIRTELPARSPHLSGIIRFWATPWLSVVTSIGMTLFTAANLAITAASHRRFWQTTNRTRREVRSVLETLLRDISDVKRRGDVGAYECALSSEAVRRLRECIPEEERLPRWNVFPFWW